MAAMLHFTSGREGFDHLTPKSYAHICSYSIFRCSHAASGIDLERKGEFAAAATSVRYTEIVASLPDNDARIVLLTDMLGAHGDSVHVAGVIITWLPPRAKLKSRMLLAGARSQIEAHARASGVDVEGWARIRAGSRSDLDLESVLGLLAAEQRRAEETLSGASPMRIGTGQATEAGVAVGHSAHAIDASAAVGGGFMAPEATVAQSDAIEGGALPVVVVLLLFAISLGAALLVWGVQVAPVLAVRDLAPRPIRMVSTLWEWFGATLADERASEL